MPIEFEEKGPSWDDLKQLTEQMDGVEIAAGVLPKAGKEKNGADLVDVAVWNEYGTKNIPKRPFIRIATRDNEKDWQGMAAKLAEGVINGTDSLQQGLEKIGNKMEGDIKEVIGDRSRLKANAPATIRKKGSDAPLKDDAELQQGISFEIR